MGNAGVRLPLGKRIQKFLCDIAGRPFIWVDFKYLPSQDLTEVIFDYNTHFLYELSDLGYDTSDPEEAVREYITNCVSQNMDDDE